MPLWAGKAWGLLAGKQEWTCRTQPQILGEIESGVCPYPEAHAVWDVTASPCLLQAEQKHGAGAEDRALWPFKTLPLGPQSLRQWVRGKGDMSES